LDPAHPVEGLADSKKLSATRREALAPLIQRRALAWSVAWADAAEIDAINILQATMLAMRRAVIGLQLVPDYIEVDGNRLPKISIAGQAVPGIAIVGGDDRVAAISAASILAKVRRDAIMCQVDSQFPDYGFARHKGYGTELHRASIQQFGPCPQHRRSFRPLKEPDG